MGISKTYYCFGENFYWNNLKIDIDNFVRLSRKYQENKLVFNEKFSSNASTQLFDKVQIII